MTTTMKYFDLADDVYIASRWHLGDVRLADGAEVNLLTGKRLSLLGPAYVDETTKGRALDFCLTSFAGPIAVDRLARAISGIAEDDVEAIPVRVGGVGGYVALNATRVIACVDETRSVCQKWTAQDHRADLVGEYRMVGNLHIDVSVVPPNAHVFRVNGWRVALIISEAVRTEMERVGCLGAKFTCVT